MNCRLIYIFSVITMFFEKLNMLFKNIFINEHGFRLFKSTVPNLKRINHI